MRNHDQNAVARDPDTFKGQTCHPMGEPLDEEGTALWHWNALYIYGEWAVLWLGDLQWIGPTGAKI